LKLYSTKILLWHIVQNVEIGLFGYCMLNIFVWQHTPKLFFYTFYSFTSGSGLLIHSQAMIVSAKCVCSFEKKKQPSLCLLEQDAEPGSVEELSAKLTACVAEREQARAEVDGLREDMEQERYGWRH
jgi:hypothetical protein